MTMTLKTKTIAALAGLAALFAIPGAAVAGSDPDSELWLRHGPRGDVVVGDNGHVVRDNGGKPVFREFDREPFPKLRRHHNPSLEIWIDPFPRHKAIKVKRCTVDQATWKAQERFGLRRVQVDYVTKHVIGVTGRKHGEWRDIVFSRAPGCPVIDY